MNRVLVIKHGSLGDIAFSLPIMHSICVHYPNVSIDLLTEKKYFNFLSKANYFNSLTEDNRSNNIIITISLLIELLKRKYDLIIDLQNSSRTSYYHLFFRIFSNVRICSSRKFSHIKYSIPIQGTETTTQGLFNQIKLLEKELKVQLCTGVQFWTMIAGDFSHFLLQVNSSISFFIYGYISSQFKKALKEFFCRCNILYNRYLTKQRYENEEEK